MGNSPRFHGLFAGFGSDLGTVCTAGAGDQAKQSRSFKLFHHGSEEFLASKLQRTEETTKLVGGFKPSEKYYIVSWDYYSIYLEK